MAVRRRGAIADADEVLSFLTSVMRGEEDEGKMADRFKAADMLGRRYRLFEQDASQGGQPVVIVDDVSHKEGADG